MSSRRLILFCAAFALLTAATSASAAADDFHYGWGETRSQCIKVENNGTELVYAHVTSSMWVHNRGIGSGWVTNFRLKARLVPTTSGLNISRNWHTTRFPVHSELLQDTDYAHAMAVNTDVMNPDADWKVEVKQVWDRKAPWHDIVRHFFLTFDTSHCRKGKTPHSANGEPPATPGAMVPGT